MTSLTLVREVTKGGYKGTGKGIRKMYNEFRGVSENVHGRYGMVGGWEEGVSFWGLWC